MPRRITVVDTLEMSAEERIRLAQDIWDSLKAVPEATDLSDEEKAFLDGRLSEFDRNPNAGDPWEVVRARIEDRR